MRVAYKKNVQLVYRDEVINNEVILSKYDLSRAIDKWFKKIQPALKRGEKIVIEIELLKENKEG